MRFIFKKKILILSVMFFIFSCFIFLFFYRVIKNNKKTSRLELQKWQTEEGRRNSVRSLIGLIKRTEPERSMIETHFVRSSDLVPFLDTIEKLSEQAGGKAEVVSVDIAKDSPALILKLRARGSFEAIYKFVMLLENSPYELLFVSANIQNPDTQDMSFSESSGIREWRADLELRLLSFIEQ